MNIFEETRKKFKEGHEEYARETDDERLVHISEMALNTHLKLLDVYEEHLQAMILIQCIDTICQDFDTSDAKNMAFIRDLMIAWRGT